MPPISIRPRNTPLAEPVVFLCCSRAIEGRNRIYLHLMTEKAPSATAMDEQNGRRLWRASERLLSSIEQGVGDAWDLK